MPSLASLAAFIEVETAPKPYEKLKMTSEKNVISQNSRGSYNVFKTLTLDFDLKP